MGFGCMDYTERPEVASRFFDADVCDFKDGRGNLMGENFLSKSCCQETQDLGQLRDNFSADLLSNT